jgi:hypothetical protein
MGNMNQENGGNSKKRGLSPIIIKVVRIGLGVLSAVSDPHEETHKEVEGGAHG